MPARGGPLARGDDAVADELDEDGNAGDVVDVVLLHLQDTHAGGAALGECARCGGCKGQSPFGATPFRGNALV